VSYGDFALTEVLEITSWAFPRSSSGVLVAVIEHEMSLEEWQNFREDPTAFTPIRFVPGSVVLFSFVDNSKFIQLTRESLVGIHVVKIGIVASPVELKTSQ
jgi:hypothetical protein